MKKRTSPTQSTLNGQDFVDRLFLESIRFNNAVLDGLTGKVYDLKNNTVFEYTLEPAEANETIDCAYFGSIFFIQTIPTGFKLLSMADNSVLREYINCFCVENQKVFGAILELLVKKGNDGFPNTVDSLSTDVRDVFSNSQSLKERNDIVNRIMDILIDEGTVSRGEKWGGEFIAFTEKTKRHLDEGRYLWKR